MHRLLRLAAALALAALALPAAAQTTGALAGTVTDDDGQPLPGVTVLIENTGRGAASDADGGYRVLNVPAGTHDVRVSFIGFGTKLIEGVQITVDKTTFLDVELAEEVVEGGDVVVEAFRVPPVETDRTFKRQVVSEEELAALPVNTITDLMTMQAGVIQDIETVPITSQPLFGEYATTPSDGLHFRGGRDGEAVYYFDGINVTDNLWGGFNIDQVGELSLNALEIQTGTFGPQYGEGMSAVVQMTTPDVVPDGFRLRAKGTTDALFPSEVSDGLASGEAQIAVPLGSRFGFVGSARGYTTDGYLYGFIYPEYIDTDGTDLSGDPVEVPMQYQDERTVNGKLIAQPLPALKVVAGGFLTDTQRGVYNHFFKYNPFGTPRVLLDSRLGYVRLNHAIGQNTYYDVTVGRYERGFRSRVFDSPDLYAILPQRATGEFSITGEDYVFFDSEFDRNLVQANVTTQLGAHQLRLGAVGEWLAVSMERYNPDPSIGEDGEYQFGVRESYDFAPRKYSAFASDKIEVVDIGMVLNLGLRLDVVDPNRPYPVDITDPFGPTGEQPARAYVSPRLGVSFPIGEQAAFRFGYGTYRQFPDFFQLYQGANETYDRYPSPNVLVVPGALASSDIEEETTTNYEAGVQVKVGPATSFDATGFYRESANLIGVEIVEATGEAAGARYPVFSNIGLCHGARHRAHAPPARRGGLGVRQLHLLAGLRDVVGPLSGGHGPLADVPRRLGPPARVLDRDLRGRARAVGRERVREPEQRHALHVHPVRPERRARPVHLDRRPPALQGVHRRGRRGARVRAGPQRARPAQRVVGLCRLWRARRRRQPVHLRRLHRQPGDVGARPARPDRPPAQRRRPPVLP